MAKRPRGRGRAAAQQSSDGGESSSDESACGVEELDVEGLRRELRRQPIEPWHGREEEIRACEESIHKKKDLRVSAAISASGCCQCFTVHHCLIIFGLLTAGLLLAAVGAGTTPRMTPANVLQKYQGVEECVVLLNGNLIPVSKWSGNPEELCDFSREKMEARMEATKELEPAPEPEPSNAEGGKFVCRKGCGRDFASPRARATHEARYCTAGKEYDDDEAEATAEIAAARTFLDGFNLKHQEIVDIATVGGIGGVTRMRPADRLLEKVHNEVASLNGAQLNSKLRAVGVTFDAGAAPGQRREAYVLSRVKRLVQPVLLARTDFWEKGEFQRSQCEAYVRGLQAIGSTRKDKRLRTKIKDLGGTPPSGSSGTKDALEAALVDAYEAQTPEVAEASTYEPLAAPKIAAVIAEHGEKLRGRANDDAVLKAVAETASGFLQQTKGGYMATNFSVVYAQTAWLIRLILSGRAVSPQKGKIFEDFKADTEGKRGGYVVADGYLSAEPGNDLQRVSYNQSAPFDEARHTLGEVVYGGNGTHGRTIVCFIIEGRKYLVLFKGREDYVLVNKVTMDCLAYFTKTVLPIVLAETSSRSTDADYGALSSDALPRLKDILASDRDEVYNRQGLRGKWNAMTRFFDGYFADVLLEIAEKGGTITSAPAALSRAADDGVPRQGPIGSSDGPKDHFHFDEGQVRNLILRLRGGGSGMCSGRGRRGGPPR